MNAEDHLRPQDIVLVLKLLCHPESTWTYAEAGEHLGQSASQIFKSASRAAASGLLYHPTLQAVPNRAAVTEFMVHGVKYAFPPFRGTMTRGMPTAWAAPPLNQHFVITDEPPPIWPYAEGSVRGIEFSPLYKTVPEASRHDSKLYELLALVDAIRGGRAREREIAIRELTVRIGPS